MTEEILQQSSKMLPLVAERYAVALFELGLEEKKLNQIKQELFDFSKLLKNNKSLQYLVQSPIFSSKEQVIALSSLFKKANFNGLGANLIKSAAKNRRLSIIMDIIHAFNRRLALHEGETFVEVFSAQDLNKEHLEALRKEIQKNVKNKIALNLHIDPSLIGGLILKIGSKMIDTSLRTKLNSLKIALKEVK